jgi:hypothetical protein
MKEWANNIQWAGRHKTARIKGLDERANRGSFPQYVKQEWKPRKATMRTVEFDPAN